MDVKRKNKAFTMVELLTVIGVIALLIGLLIPALTMVRNLAKKTQQKVQFTTIGLAINAFKSDYGDYPPSSPKDLADLDYSGAQKLAEALLGWDLLGFHPDSAFRSDGEDDSGNPVYPLNLDPGNPADLKNLQDRKGPYLDVETANAFKLNSLFNNTDRLEGNTFVLCDVFGVKKITITQSGGKRVTFKAGTPILYYRANTSRKNHTNSPSYDQRIYNVYDDKFLVDLGKVTPDGTGGKDHLLGDDNLSYKVFYDYITDLKVTAVPWPYRPDSYILISAGADGLYGTGDDITNFEN